MKINEEHQYLYGDEVEITKGIFTGKRGLIKDEDMFAFYLAVEGHLHLIRIYKSQIKPVQ